MNEHEMLLISQIRHNKICGLAIELWDNKAFPLVIKNEKFDCVRAHVGVVVGLFSNLENIQALFRSDQYKDEK